MVSPNRCRISQKLYGPGTALGEDGLRSDGTFGWERQAIRSEATHVWAWRATVYHWGLAILGRSIAVVGSGVLALFSYNKGVFP